jgi:LemA protein
LSTSKILLIAAGVLVVVIAIFGFGISGTYNSLVGLDQTTQAAWAQVQNAYQRRLDLIPNLVETVKGAAKFEQETLTAVTEARARVGQLTPQSLESTINDPAALKRFEEAQAGLGSALQRLMVVVEKYPELRATQAFRDLSVSLESTENRINVERKHYNDAAREFNVRRDSFPTVLIAGFFGDKFRPKAYFAAETGAEKAPSVTF